MKKHGTIPSTSLEFYKFIKLLGKGAFGKITLGIPILVLRNETERPEAVEAGTVQLIGPNKTALIESASAILSRTASQESVPQNPYGDGKAVSRILYALHQFAEARLYSQV